MSRHRTSRFRRNTDPPMRPDDKVGPGIRRRAGFVALALSSLLFGIGLPFGFELVTGIAQNAQEDARLSQEEISEVRSYLTDRRNAREAEADEVQKRLDQQTAALCAALAEVAKDAGPSGRAALARAGKSLGCAALPKAMPTSSSSSIDGSSSTSGSGPTGSAPPGSPAARAPSSSGGTGSSPAPQPPPPRPTPEPAGDGVLDPVTDTVCDLRGVCL